MKNAITLVIWSWSDLFIKAQHLQQLNRYKKTGLMELVTNVEETLQVSAAQRVQNSAIHQMSLKCLGILRKPNITEPCCCNPVVVHVRSFGQSEKWMANTD